MDYWKKHSAQNEASGQRLYLFDLFGMAYLFTIKWCNMIITMATTILITGISTILTLCWPLNPVNLFAEMSQLSPLPSERVLEMPRDMSGYRAKEEVYFFQQGSRPSCNSL